MKQPLPTWTELTKDEQGMLESLASTFGPDGTLLSDRISHFIAVEMYMASRLIITRRKHHEVQ